MNNEALCVGGSHDGEMLSVGENSRDGDFVRLAKMMRPPNYISSEGYDIPTPAVYEQEAYSRKTFYFAEGSFDIWISAESTVMGAMQRLLELYPPRILKGRR